MPATPECACFISDKNWWYYNIMISYLDLIGLVCFVINYIGQALSLLNAGRSSKIYLIYLKIELPDDRAITIVVVFHHPSV